jgi:hypothetical protein
VSQRVLVAFTVNSRILSSHVHECHGWLNRRGMAGEQGEVLHTSLLRPPTRRFTGWSLAKGEHSSMVEDTPTSVMAFRAMLWQ